MDIKKDSNKTFYIFGSKNFLGVVKFYNKQKGFGFIVSNNHGMSCNRRFISNEQSFYFDKATAPSNLIQGELIVFKPYISNGRLQANDIEKYEIKKDEYLILSYFISNNYITYLNNNKKITIDIFNKSGLANVNFEAKQLAILKKEIDNIYKTTTDLFSITRELSDTINMYSELPQDYQWVIKDSITVAFIDNYKKCLSMLNSYHSIGYIQELAGFVTLSWLVKIGHSEISFLYKEKIKELFKKMVYENDYQSSFIELFQHSIHDSDYDEFLDSLAKDIEEKWTLRQIANYYANFYKKQITEPVNEYIANKELNQILDFGNFFQALSDKGVSLIKIIFDKVFSSINSEGNFINSKDEKDKTYFIYYWVYQFRNDYTFIQPYINKLSGHDRVLVNEVESVNIASVNDFIQEIIYRGYNGDIDKLISINNGTKALIEIIIQLDKSSHSFINDTISWVRKYMSIQSRHFNNSAQYEERLINHLCEIQTLYKVDFSKYGIYTSSKRFAPCYKDYMQYNLFLSYIWRALIEEKGEIKVIRLTLEEDKLDDFSLWLISKILCCNIIFKEKVIEIVLPKYNTPIDDSKIVSYLTINFLNNIDKKMLYNNNMDNIEIDLIKNDSLILLFNNVFGMEAKDYMEAFWRVGDRGDIENYYKYIRFMFPFNPNSTYISLLYNAIPDIKPTEDPRLFEYNYHETEIASGYGRSYDYDHSISYKSGFVWRLAISFFNAFKTGCGFEEID